MECIVGYWVVFTKITLDDFRGYLNGVRKIYALTSQITRYHGELLNQASSREVGELRDDIRNMILYGLQSNGEYSDRAYALFIRDFMGLYLEDPKLFISKLKLGRLDGVKVVARDTDFIEFVKLLNHISKYILDKARSLNINVGNTATIGGSVYEKYAIEDLIAELLESMYNISVGVNSFATRVWSIRKTTPHYMRKAHNIQEPLLKILGFSKILSINNYELWGFKDYFTECTVYKTRTSYGDLVFDGISINGVPIPSKSRKRRLKEKYGRALELKLETLGGAICAFNEVIWRYNELLKETFTKWFNGVLDIEKEYIRKAWDSLNEIGWTIPEYLKQRRGLYIEFSNETLLNATIEQLLKFTFLVYDKDGVISKGLCWARRRRGIEFDEFALTDYIVLPELFNDLMPAIYLGVVDATLYFNLSYDISYDAILLLFRRRV